MNSETKPAVILLSGGLDSATVLALAAKQGFELNALSFRYGQRHRVELDRARDQARLANVKRHIVVDIDLTVWGGSALTDSAISVPKNQKVEDIGDQIPVTYVPARNTIFLSFALGWAETVGASDLFIGVNALDYSGYPDCRPEYIAAFEKMANLATKASVTKHQPITIHTPLIHLTKSQIVQLGIDLQVDYSKTVSCYDPTEQGAACGHCDACLLRLRGFQQAGLPDPGIYSNRI